MTLTHLGLYAIMAWEVFKRDEKIRAANNLALEVWLLSLNWEWLSPEQKQVYIDKINRAAEKYNEVK